MKKVLKLLIVVLIFSFLIIQCLNSSAAEISVITDNDKYNTEYFDLYGIPTSYFSYENNGGQNSDSEIIDKAFDRNFNTIWKSGLDNNVKQGDVDNFKNTITITFKQEVTIKAIAYQAENYSNGRGYPISLSIYTGYDDVELYGTIESSPTNELVVFNLTSEVKLKKLVFEYTSVNRSHKYCATAREIIFLQPENSAAEEISSLFTDYANLTLKSGVNKATLNDLRNQASSMLAYETNLKPILDRAEMVLSGLLRKDDHREFSTANGSLNEIRQYGDIRSYASNVLKMSSMGTNRQATGIFAVARQTINVYVTALATDKLPSIAFTQPYGDWRSWKAEYSLKVGLNTFTVPSFLTENYTIETADASVIHIINPYTEDEQSENVKIYIEGGDYYPLFKKGSDEETFRLFLADYALKVTSYPESYPDVLELEGDHTLITVRAVNVYTNKIYTNNSPQECISNWDNTIQTYLALDGVTFNPQDKYYNPINEHVNVNIRLAQPWGGAAGFAANDHVGVVSWEGSCYYGKNFGWGFAHEVGHAMDMNERLASECTNNMISQLNMVVLENNNSRSADWYDVIANKLGISDSSDINNLWNQNRQYWIIYWLIESRFPGFWGKQDNIYRYENTAVGLTKTEKQVYYASLATGIDLSYYFERWGFDIDYSADESVPFTYANSSDAFKNYMLQAINSGKIEKNELKLWYLDNTAYEYMVQNGKGCYSSTDRIEITSINKVSGGYSIILPNSNNTAHLGYEILIKVGEEYKVIGFTRTNSFTDNNEYSTTPEYYIRAYDRLLNATALSSSKEIESSSNVCRIGNNYYNSLAEAIFSASNGAIIYLVKDTYECNIIIDKDITIMIDPAVNSDLRIIKIGSGDLFTIKAAKTLVLNSSTLNYKLILDGYNLEQSGPLLRVEGTLQANRVIFRDTINNDNGGAIYTVGYIDLGDCEFSGNVAKNGAAIYGDGTGADIRIRLINVILKNNIATNNGGAIWTRCTALFKNCNFNNNDALNGGAIANVNGGVLTLNNCLFDSNKATSGGALYLDGKTTISGGLAQNNAALKGNVIFFSGSNQARSLNLSKFNNESLPKFINNSLNACDIYLDKGQVNISALDTDNDLCLVSGAVNFIGEDIKLAKFIRIGGSILVNQIPNNVTVFDNQSEEDILLSHDPNMDVNKLLSMMEIINGEAISSDNNTISTKAKKFKITYQYQNEQLVKEYPQASEIILKDLNLIDKYVISFKNGNNTYYIGDAIIINSDLILDVTLGDKYIVTLDYLDTTKDYYVIPGQKQYLPFYSLDTKREIFAWQQDSNIYYPYDGVEINKNVTLKAIYSALEVQFIDDKGNYQRLLVGYGDKIILPANLNPGFIGWRLGDQVFESFEEIEVTYNLTFNAVYELNTNDPDSNNDSIDNNSSNQLQNNINVYLAMVIIIALAIVIVVILVIIKKKKK